MKKDQEYFWCINYAQHDVQTRQAFTEMVFNFYNGYLPGIEIHRRGYVSPSDLDLVFNGVLLTNYARETNYSQEFEVEKKNNFFGQSETSIFYRIL